MRDAQPKTIYAKDYRAPDYLIDHTELLFRLGDACTEVQATLSMRRNPDSDKPANQPLVLDGQQLLLKSLALDGKALGDDDYLLASDTLTIHAVPETFQLQCVTEIKPEQNTSLEGLYMSDGMYCTQCEAEGFRKITYYLDRPDVMSVYTVTIEADKIRYPVLLSNGNLDASGDNDDGTHWARWHDPFKKPCYLFALVAGDLQFIEEQFTTGSGRDVCLRIYVEQKDLGKCDHAMRSLINAMRWDEDVYGREYDLDIFNIVAVDAFNMGAMENKSLNIFNTSCVLAAPDTTTDAGFQRVEGVVAHEYFHNWSGNRVTCRDWFQLSLKEGFTVFRDAGFSADMGSATVKRVEDVQLLRTAQFAEDAGPMSHPVRPDSYIEISNFYTLTIYEKGAEVVRMIHTLLGPELFRKGSDLYFERHDGQAVTCEDFVKAMEDASGKDLTQFRCWYSQAGTPQLTVSGDYDQAAQRYTLIVKQHCEATPGQQQKAPFHIPLAISLLGDAGALPLSLAGNDSDDNTAMVLDVTEVEQQFCFDNVMERPVPSLLRGFSAPVKLAFDYSRDDLITIMSRDSDGFSRWDAAQQLGVQVLNEMMATAVRGETPTVDTRLIEAYRTVLADHSLDPAMVALTLALPTESYLAELADVADVHAIHAARSQARQQLAEALADDWLAVYRRYDTDSPYQASAGQIAQRSLKNLALSYLMVLETEDARELCRAQYQRRHNMTDVLAALRAVVNSRFDSEREELLADFFQRWQHEPLVVNQWFMVQAQCPRAGTLDQVRSLLEHPAFDIKNPNKVRSLIGAFCGQNPVNFHQRDGAGYQFLAGQILVLNKLNPQIAARLLTPLTKWKKYPEASQQLMQQQLERIQAEPTLSKDVYEVVSKSLQG